VDVHSWVQARNNSAAYTNNDSPGGGTADRGPSLVSAVAVLPLTEGEFHVYRELEQRDASQRAGDGGGREDAGDSGRGGSS